MLYLSASDIVQAADPDQVMDAVEHAYRVDEAGKYNMPPRMHISHHNDTVLYMPCFLEDVFGTKVLSLFPANESKNIPVISGLVILNDVQNGSPVAILDGAKVTAIRTGAVGGVAVRHTTPHNAESVGLIGAGIQGYHQVLFASAARKIKRVLVYDLAIAKTENLCKQLRSDLPMLEIGSASTVEEILRESEIVITATPSRKAVLPDDRDLLMGKSYIGIGSYKPEMHEFPKSIYALVDQVLVDTEHGLEESGDLITPLASGWIERNQIKAFGSYLASKNKANFEAGTTLFKSVGMALFDIVVSKMIFEKAKEKGLGIELN